jgi:hypothetical protein
MSRAAVSSGMSSLHCCWSDNGADPAMFPDAGVAG